MTRANKTDAGHMSEVADPSARSRTSVLGRLARRGWTAGAAAGLALGLSLLTASPASAYVGANVLRNWETGRCLDSGFASENGRGTVYTNPCDTGNLHQIWQPIYVGHTSHDVVLLQDRATGLCLSRDLDVSTASCNGGDINQQWLAVGTGWDRIQFKPLGSGTCLDSNSSGSAYLLGCNGGGNQLWKLGF